MNIDWFTFAAQIINFLILLALLKRFLYGPILKGIAEREAEVASRFERAEIERSAAEAAKLNFDARMEELTHARQRMLAEATEEAEQWKREQISNAREEVANSRADWFHQLGRERQQLQDRLLEQYRMHALKLADGVVRCLADAESQSVIVGAFIRNFQKSKASPRLATTEQPNGLDQAVIVRSAFELTDSQQTDIREVLIASGVDPATIQFRRDESLICGIEVRTKHHEVSWNARESLTFLAGEFNRDLDELLALPHDLITDAEPAHAR
jgi:F-type H+-transporting ATPase subunit b